jgi:hypothetical protein
LNAWNKAHSAKLATVLGPPERFGNACYGSADLPADIQKQIQALAITKDAWERKKC